MWPSSILMVSPTSPKAFTQWARVKSTYQRLGLDVEVLEGDPQFPEMVFCANQCFPFRDQDGRKCIVLSRMSASERQGEIRHFREWAQEKGYQIFEATDFEFEGCGDAIWNFEKTEIFGGYGFRTDVRAYDQIEKIVGRPVHRLLLCDPEFPQLDTCFSVLNAQTAVYVEEAFDGNGLRLLASKFRNLIRIHREEALESFAGNCFSPNGKDVLLHPGALDLREKLYRLGFQLHEVDTSEFIKAGGSVFGLKQTLF